MMAIGLSLGLGLGARSGTSLAAQVAALFGPSDTGWLYDNSDFSTMFQDSAGTIPVTAVGQSVGLQLDKSKGLVLGPELVTNGDFSSGGTGWSLDTWVVSGGVATANNITNRSLAQNISLPQDRVYEISFTISNYSSGSAIVVFTGGAGQDTSLSFTGNGLKTTKLRSSAARTTFVIFCSGLSNFSVDNVSVRELPGNHRFQSVSLNRPTLRQDTNGLYYLEYDGLNDSLATSAFDWGTDKATVVAGVRKLSDAQVMVIAGFSANINANNGAFEVSNYNGVGGVLRYYCFRSKGTLDPGVVFASDYVAPITNVLTGLGDISGDRATLRVNGTQVAQNTADQGAGNYGNYPVYFGARAGTSLFFNGREYSQFAINRLLTEGELELVESYTNSRTGAY